MTFALRARYFVLAGLLVSGPAASSLRGEAPVISGLSPRGAQRGKSVVLVVEGANLSPNTELVLGLPGPRALRKADPPPAPNRIAFDLQLSGVDAPGPYPLRVRTEEGVSNPVLFLVGLFPEVAEVEPNDVTEAAQAVEAPITINGGLGATDRDNFRFRAKRGQSLSFEVEGRRIGSAMDPTLHVLTASGREMAMSEDAPGLGVDARIDLTFAEDGEYLVQVHDAMYLSQAPGFYRLKIGPLAHAEGIFPLGGRRGSEVLVTFEGGNLPQPVTTRARLDVLPPVNQVPVALPPPYDTGGALPFQLRIGDLTEVLESRAKPEEPQALAAPLTVNGRLEKTGEVDRYALEVKPAQRWTFEVEAAGLGSFLDGVLEVSKPDGGRLANADDNGPSMDPRLEFTVPEGVSRVILSVEDLHRRGGPGFAYRLTARETVADFVLNLATPTVNLPLKGAALVAVDVVRRGYNGPVRLDLLGVPPGYVVRGGVIPPGQAKGFLSVSGPEAGRLALWNLIVRGFGDGDLGPAYARGAVFLAADRGMPVSPLLEEEVTLAVARPLPISIRVEEGPAEVVLGHQRQVKVLVSRGEGGDGALKLQGVFAPPGITAGEGTVAEKAGEGTFALTADPAAPLAEGDAAVKAVVKLNGKDVSLVAPIFRTRVVPPFQPELAKPAFEGALGASVALEGRIHRTPPFAGEVEVKLDGLPMGLSAPPVVVPAAQSAFKIQLAMADPAKPGRAELKLVASTKLGDPKKPVVYAAPPLAFGFTLQPAAPAPEAVAPAGGGAPAAPKGGAAK